MQTTLYLAAALLYAVCAFLPTRKGALISAITAAAWLLHGAQPMRSHAPAVFPARCAERRTDSTESVAALVPNHAFA